MRIALLLSALILSGCQVTRQEPNKPEPRNALETASLEWKRYRIGKSPVLISDANQNERVIYLVNESETLIAVGGETVSIFGSIGLLGSSPNNDSDIKGRLQMITASEIYVVAWEEGSILAVLEHPLIEPAQTKKRKPGKPRFVLAVGI